jgi:hypothetical protein
MKLAILWLGAGLALLSVSAAPAAAPPLNDRFALARVVTHWDAGCDGSTRAGINDMVGAWYDNLTSFDEHGAPAWVQRGYYHNGNIVDSDFTDVDRADWGKDEAAAHVDEPDVAMIALHGGNALADGHWYGVVRVDEAGDGDCYADQAKMELGDGDLEFLHMMSCVSLDEEDWIHWTGSFKGLHQLEGFHGEAWSSQASSWRFREFADDGYDTGMAIAWVENLYKYRVAGENQCPVSMAAGHGTDPVLNAWTRINSERYNNVYSDPAVPGWFAIIYVEGCNPKMKGPLPASPGSPRPMRRTTRPSPAGRAVPGSTHLWTGP